MINLESLKCGRGLEIPHLQEVDTCLVCDLREEILEEKEEIPSNPDMEAIVKLNSHIEYLENENASLSAVVCPENKAIGDKYGNVFCSILAVVEEARVLVEISTEANKNLGEACAGLCEALAKLEQTE